MTLPPIHCTYKLSAGKMKAIGAKSRHCLDNAISFFRSRKKGFYMARCETHHPDSTFFENIPRFTEPVVDQISQEEYVIGMVMES